MKISLKLASLALALIASSLTLNGCSGQDGRDGQPGLAGRDGEDGVDGQDGKNGSNGKDGKDACTGPDPIFWLILRDFEEADRYYGTCMVEATADHANCIATSKETDFYCVESGSCQTYCQNGMNQKTDTCHRYTVWRANKTAVRSCGAKVFTYIEPTAEMPYSNLGGVIDEDTDGDGLSNFMEYLLLLNPCSKTSYGSCTLDAELDGDFDGEPNGTDAYPFCNLQDPENVSDCILSCPNINNQVRLNHDVLSSAVWDILIEPAPHLSFARVAFCFV